MESRVVLMPRSPVLCVRARLHRRLASIALFASAIGLLTTFSYLRDVGPIWASSTCGNQV